MAEPPTLDPGPSGMVPGHNVDKESQYVNAELFNVETANWILFYG
jgi:hypothetical protein